MAAPARLYSYTAGASAVGSNVQGEFNNLYNALTDGSKDITIENLQTGDGTLAAPSWSYDGDTDTGFYRIGADNMGLSIGGNKVFDITTTVMIINDEGDDFDFTIEGDTDTQLFKTDGGDDAVFIGSNANSTDFSAAKLIVSQADSANASTQNIAVVAEAVASGSGVGSIATFSTAKTSGADSAEGVRGTSTVGAAGDTALAIGVRGVSKDTHTGEDNIGFYADVQNASGSGQNIAFDALRGMIRVDNSFAGSGSAVPDADKFHIGAEDLSAGNTQLSLYGEGTSVGTGTPAASRTIAVKVNGTQYYILSALVAS